MRILILDTRPLRRGAQVFAHDLSNGLHLKGVEVKKIYLYAVRDFETLTLNTQDEILEGNDAHIFEKIPTIHPWLLFKLIKRINVWQPDIILLNGSRTLKYGVAARKFLSKKVKLVYRVIDSVVFWNDKFYKQFYYRKLIMPYIDAAAGVSTASLNDMKSLHHFKKPSTVIYRAIDTNSFQSIPDKIQCRKNLGVDQESKILLFLGNLTSQKRPDRFIRIFKGVKKSYPDIKAWIVGDGELKNEVKDVLAKECLESSVLLWGYQKNVGPFLAAADILLLTSDTEGLPGVVLEAGYFCVPSVSTDVGGIRECIENEKTGLIVPVEDIETFIKSAIRLLSNEELRLKMGKEAQNKINNSFTMNTATTKYYEFFSSLLPPSV